MTNAAVKKFFADLNTEIGEATDEKVIKALTLFSEIDETMKGVVIHNSPFYQGKIPLTAKNLREWVEDLAKDGTIFDLIDEMEEDLMASALPYKHTK